jgi:hypothetical protein
VRKLVRALALCLAASSAACLTWLTPALADSHIPSIDIEPNAIFSTSGNITNAPGVPGVDGIVLLNGSVHVPILRGLTFSYDHVTNGLIYGTIGRVAIGGKFVATPLIFRDYFDTFRLDGTLTKGVNLELGSLYRHRVCCPADSDPSNPTPTFYHDNYLSASYTTPAVTALHGTTLTYSFTGHSSPHFSDAASAVAAANAAGYPDAKRTEFGITQAATLIVPVDPAHGFSVAGTFTWGAFNYFSNQPIPFYYDIFVLSATKSINKYLSFTASMDNFIQRPQGYPFDPGSGLNGASLNVGADIHGGP